MKVDNWVLCACRGMLAALLGWRYQRTAWVTDGDEMAYERLTIRTADGKCP